MVDDKQVPVKWQYPVGVLFDAYHPMEVSPACPGSPVTTAPPQSWNPLKITIHFQKHPIDIVPFAVNGPSTVETQYFSVLKQALYLCFRSTAPVRDLPAALQERLWEAVAAGDFKTYYELYLQILRPQRSEQNTSIEAPEVPSTQTTTSEDRVNEDKGDERAMNEPSEVHSIRLLTTTCRCFPVRIITVDQDTGTIVLHQKPVPYRGKMTIEDFFLCLDETGLPFNLFSGSSASKAVNKQLLCCGIDFTQPALFRGLTLNFCVEHFHYADCFLYFVIR